MFCSKISATFLGQSFHCGRSVCKKLADNRNSLCSLVNHNLIRLNQIKYSSSSAYVTRYGDFEHIQVTSPHDHVLHVELNRPEKRNSINREMFREISNCFSEISVDQQCRVVVISGAGKMFCSGIDYMDLISLMTSAVSGSDSGAREDVAARAKFIRQLIVLLQNSFNSISKCPKPVIGAIHNGCIGAGVDLITTTDIRIASKDAYFCIKETSYGMAADLGTLQRLPKIIGNQSVISELAFTGRDLSAAEAKEIGLVSNVYENHQSCLDGAMEIAKKIASKSPVAVQGTKQVLNYSREHSEKDGLEFIQIWNMCMLQSEDFAIASLAMATRSKDDPSFADF